MSEAKKQKRLDRKRRKKQRRDSDQRRRQEAREFHARMRQGELPVSDISFRTDPMAAANPLDEKTALRFTDVNGAYTSLAAHAVDAIRQLFEDLGNEGPLPGFHVISHAEGSLLIQVADSGAVIRYVSSETPANLYVRATEVEDPRDPISIDLEILAAFIKLLTPEQRVALMDALAAA